MSAPAVAVPGRRLKVGVYNLYWQTMGGGEQVAGAIAEVLSSEHDVDVLGPVAPPVEAMRSRLAIDLGRTTYRQVNDDPGASEASAYYDLFVTTTYLSTAVNRAPAGLYYAHFPEPPASGSERRRIAVARQAVKAIDRLPVQPARVTAARAEFASRVRSRDFLASYSAVLGNSEYTCGWIKRLWGVDASPARRRPAALRWPGRGIAGDGRSRAPRSGAVPSGPRTRPGWWPTPRPRPW